MKVGVFSGYLSKLENGFYHNDTATNWLMDFCANTTFHITIIVKSSYELEGSEFFMS